MRLGNLPPRAGHPSRGEVVVMSQYQGRARMDIWKWGTLIKTRSGALGSRSRRENRRDESPRTTRAPLCAAPRTLNKHLKQRKFIHSTPCLLDSLLHPLQERGPLMIGRILTQPDGAHWPRAAFAGRGSGGTVRSWDAASGRLRGTYPAARATWPTRRSLPTARWWSPAAATAIRLTAPRSGAARGAGPWHRCQPAASPARPPAR